MESLALHELIDPRITDSYNTYEMYNMVRTAYLCVQTDPAQRPLMADVVRLLFLVSLMETFKFANDVLSYFGHQ